MRRVGGPGCPLPCALCLREGCRQVVLAPSVGTHGAPPMQCSWCSPGVVCAVLPRRGAPLVWFSRCSPCAARVGASRVCCP